MKHQYRDYILDLLQPHGPITARSLFGGYGIYYGSSIIGIIVESELYFKVDEQTRPDYEAIGSVPFIYQGKTKTVAMSYMKVPVSLLENGDELPTWIEKAYEVSLRSKKTKRRPKRRTISL